MGILAVFGSEVAAEDDAERAVRCGLSLLELGRALGAEVLAGHGQAGFDVRVGVYTGGVLLGGGDTGEKFVVHGFRGEMSRPASPKHDHASVISLADCWSPVAGQFIQHESGGGRRPHLPCSWAA